MPLRASPKDGAHGLMGRSLPLVLTHDVEGPAGLGKCLRLAELEASLGFRSSFNLIPEGPYTVPPQLRAQLEARGFEIGVHDLHHDGELYRSRKAFRKGAECINRYIKEWNAVGFSSGFMFHELDWIHDLNIEYDSSTFDTDPFEPQPDGVGTIFPFWVPPPKDDPIHKGYIELPYTLPQDSTLFLILRERSPDIWLNKLDWLAKHGGMALVNVHPDYLQFPGEPAESQELFRSSITPGSFGISAVRTERPSGMPCPGKWPALSLPGVPATRFGRRSVSV